MNKGRYQFEKKLWNEGFDLVMGLDEVGRGCLAGPVVAAGVILRPKSYIEGIKDSKQLSATKREELGILIRREALFYTVQFGSVNEIVEHNILWASLLTMQKCVEKATPSPDYLLIDGNRYLDSLIPHECIVKGDDRSATIGAASILAKVERDSFMRKLHQKFPYYGWDTNVGYPTKAHYAGLQEYGYTIHHRRNFNLKTTKVFVP